MEMAGTDVSDIVSSLGDRLIFDNNNRLEGIEIRDKTSDKKIVKLGSKTPTPGDTVTIVDQIFSNLRRKNLD